MPRGPMTAESLAARNAKLRAHFHSNPAAQAALAAARERAPRVEWTAKMDAELLDGRASRYSWEWIAQRIGVAIPTAQRRFTVLQNDKSGGCQSPARSVVSVSEVRSAVLHDPKHGAPEP